MPEPAADAVIESWLAGARAGDRAAFAELVRAHQSRVRLQLRRLTRGDAASADDLAQETFLQAWLHLAGFRGECRFATWLHRVALNCYLRQARRSSPPLEWSDMPAGETGEPSESANTALRLDLESALGELTEIQQLAIVHCYHLDLSHAEAAEVLGLPIGTLKSHVDRAKARLRQRLAAWQPESTT